jgi:hypothetical protein
MPRPLPLPSPTAARKTLVHRFAARADRLRQLYTRFGMRSRRVFLVWTVAAGEERGAGSESVIARRELLPTPKVSDATGITRRPISIGEIPDGSVRLEQVSAGAYTEDNLRGKSIPQDYAQGMPQPGSSQQLGGTDGNPLVVQPFDFFYEIVEDGRGDDPAARSRFRLLASPWRNESGMYWGIYLQPMSGPLDRMGNPTYSEDDVTDE